MIEEVVDYLLTDVQAHTGKSTAGDKGLCRRVGKQLPYFLKQFRQHLLLSV